METIYPQETLDLLAKYDALLNTIIKEYEQSYPFPPEWLREVLGEERYARQYHAAAHKRRTSMLSDPIYQACLTQKAHIIEISPFKLLFDAEELKQMRMIGQEEKEQ